MDIIYVGTDHAFYKQNCLDAIRVGKHVLCEKPLTINAKEAARVLGAAKAKGVYVVEGVWTRHFPIVKALNKSVHGQGMIGSVNRVFCGFAFDMNLQSLSSQSRLKNPALDAGSLLNIDISMIQHYVDSHWPQTQHNAGKKKLRKIIAVQKVVYGVEIATLTTLNPDGPQW